MTPMQGVGVMIVGGFALAGVIAYASSRWPHGFATVFFGLFTLGLLGLFCFGVAALAGWVG